MIEIKREYPKFNQYNINNYMIQCKLFTKDKVQIYYKEVIINYNYIIKYYKNYHNVLN